jgi:hypothetical protein
MSFQFYLYSFIKHQYTQPTSHPILLHTTNQDTYLKISVPNKIHISPYKQKLTQNYSLSAFFSLNPQKHILTTHLNANRSISFMPSPQKMPQPTIPQESRRCCRAVSGHAKVMSSALPIPLVMK